MAQKKIDAILVSIRDSVAIVNRPVRRGEVLAYMNGGDMMEITAADDIPIYHKIALLPIRAGEPVLKYGERIEHATRDIPAGAHVHSHNLTDMEEEGR